MKITFVYVVPWNEYEAYRPFVDRFCSTAGSPLRTYLWCNPSEQDLRTTTTLHPYIVYMGGGRDIGAFQHAAHSVDCDILICANTRVHFKLQRWLDRLLEVWNQKGPALYGATASREHMPPAPANAKHRNPHLRTSFFACPPQWLREYPYAVSNRQECYEFECGARSFTQRMLEARRRVFQVTWTEVVPYPFRRVRNGYRDGDQSELLAFDRATDEYEAANPQQKMELERLSGLT